MRRSILYPLVLALALVTTILPGTTHATPPTEEQLIEFVRRGIAACNQQFGPGSGYRPSPWEGEQEALYNCYIVLWYITHRGGAVMLEEPGSYLNPPLNGN